MMNGHSKINSQHLDRMAIVYVRQSSQAQVRDNTESTARQYALSDLAVRLGWNLAKIEVIDADLGLSGASAAHRSGFREIVGRVCCGEVGAIFGLEISRLARSTADLSRLLELVRLSDTLVIDSDGVYNLNDFNDRLLLGIKGNISEAELHLMAGRLHGAKQAAAKRGELRCPLPIGYVYDDIRATVKDPDQEIQMAITDLFVTFRAMGSACGVAAHFKDRRFPGRVFGGAWAGVLRWGPLTHSRVLNILTNPTYAGAYTYGRYHLEKHLNPDGSVHKKIVRRQREKWEVLLQNRHPAYISWEEFLENASRLEANQTAKGARPPREGIPLLQGILSCGGCGHKMATSYRANGQPYYSCPNARSCAATRSCRSVTVSTIDSVVATRLLEALSPEDVAQALAAADEVADRRLRTTKAAELAVERARYEATRAERAFLVCEPENRLVARSLENRWESMLVLLAEAEAALTKAQTEKAPLPPRNEVESIVGNLPGLWNAPTTSAKDRKRLLRTLIADVTLISEQGSKELRIGIHWCSGATEQMETTRPPLISESRRTPVKVIDLITRLGPTMTNVQLVTELNKTGCVTGCGRPFNVKAVYWLRHVYQIPSPSPFATGELSVREVACRLGISQNVVRYWIKRDEITVRRSITGHLCINFSPQIEQSCRQRVAASSRIEPTSPTSIA